MIEYNFKNMLLRIKLITGIYASLNDTQKSITDAEKLWKWVSTGYVPELPKNNNPDY